MHIPDGMLSLETSVVAWAVSATAIGYAARRAGRELSAAGEFSERRSLLMGVAAAFIFAAQMMNFAVAGGTSGHLIGGALLAILLGPWSAIVVMAAVLVVQALLFQDGGLLALGANFLNMAVVSVVVASVVHNAIARVFGDRSFIVAISGFAAAWLSVVVAALFASIELAVSGTVAWGVVLPAMGLVHMLIGIGEGLITVAVLSFLRATRPDLLRSTTAPSIEGGKA